MATIREMVSARYGTDIGAGGDTEAEGTIAELLSRRSIRLYEDRPIDDDLLDVLLACAQSAPTKSNLQQYSIVVVQDKATRAKLAPFVPRTKSLPDVPGVLVFCADLRRGQRVTGFRGKQHCNNNMDTFLNATVDASLAMGFFVVAAEAAGLGCAPLSSLRDYMYQVAEVLELPDGVFPVAGVMFGWPSAQGYVNQRLPQSIVVHRERYDGTGMEDGVTDYDRTLAEHYRSQGKPTVDHSWSQHMIDMFSESPRPDLRAELSQLGFEFR